MNTSVTRRIKILHLLTRLLKGGSDEHTLATIEGCSRERYEFVLAYGSEFDPDQVARAERIGVQTHIFPALINRPAPSIDPGVILALTRWIKHEGFDIVHTHQTKAGIIGRIAAKLAGTPCIVHTCHGFGFGALNSKLMDRAMLYLERLCAKWTHCNVYVSGYQMKEALKLGIGTPSKSMVIRSGKDVERYRLPSKIKEEEETLTGRHRPVTVYCATRLAPGKGLENLIEAISLLASDFPNLRVWIVGEGPLRGQLERMINNCNLGHLINLLGFRNDIPELLAEVDIVVLASLREGLPQSLTEAMIAGKAVIATPVGGIPEVVHDGETGLLIPPGKPKELAVTLCRLLKDEGLRRSLGERAAKELGLEFSREKMLQLYDSLYTNLYSKLCYRV